MTFAMRRQPVSLTVPAGASTTATEIGWARGGIRVGRLSFYAANKSLPQVTALGVKNRRKSSRLIARADRQNILSVHERNGVRASVVDQMTVDADVHGNDHRIGICEGGSGKRPLVVIRELWNGIVRAGLNELAGWEVVGNVIGFELPRQQP